MKRQPLSWPEERYRLVIIQSLFLHVKCFFVALSGSLARLQIIFNSRAHHPGFSYVVTIRPQFLHCRLRMMLPSGRERV